MYPKQALRPLGDSETPELNIEILLTSPDLCLLYRAVISFHFCLFTHLVDVLSRVDYDESLPPGFILMRKHVKKQRPIELFHMPINLSFVVGFTDDERWKNIFNNMKPSQSLRSSSKQNMDWSRRLIPEDRMCG